MDPLTSRSPVPGTAFALIEGLVDEQWCVRNESNSLFYDLYARPLARHLKEKFDLSAEDAQEVVHEFLAKNFWTAEPGDSLVVKYLERLGLSYVASCEAPLDLLDGDARSIEYLLAAGAARLSGERTRSSMPSELSQRLLGIAGEHFEEIREDSSRSFGGYLLRAAYNFMIDRVRRKSRNRPLHVDPNQQVAPAREEEVDLALQQITALFEDVLARLRADPNLTLHCDIFDAYVTEPAKTGRKPQMAAIAIRFREALAASTADSSPLSEQQLAKLAANRLDAFRRRLWSEVEQRLTSALPTGLQLDLKVLISSRSRNQLLKECMRRLKKGEDSGSSDYSFAQNLSVFLDEEAEGADDMALRHEWLVLLSEPLYKLLSLLGVPEATSYRGLVEEGGQPLRHLEDCLRHSAPPLSLLTQLKEFAKPREQSQGDPISKPLRMVIYLSAIVMARRQGKCITQKNDEQVSHSVRKALCFDWLDDATRNFLADPS